VKTTAKPAARGRPIPGDEPAAKDRQFVAALSRGLAILRCFTHEEPELSVSEIARRTKLPQPTVWRLCHTLRESGYLAPARADGKITLGIPVLALGYAVLCRQDVAQLALPHLQEMTDQLRLGTSLAVRDGLEMVYLQRTHGDFIYMNDPVGARRPIATAPTGWACLAAYDEAERTEVLRNLKRHDAKSWRATERNISSALEEYEHLGFILSLGVMHEHFNAVATPIRCAQGGRVYGLSASGLASVWPREKLLAIGQKLVALAKDLSTAPSPTTAQRKT
jgi:DNA-binding IclR family transcriptional regulator